MFFLLNYIFSHGLALLLYGNLILKSQTPLSVTPHALHFYLSIFFYTLWCDYIQLIILKIMYIIRLWSSIVFEILWCHIIISTNNYGEINKHKLIYGPEVNWWTRSITYGVIISEITHLLFIIFVYLGDDDR